MEGTLPPWKALTPVTLVHSVSTPADSKDFWADKQELATGVLPVGHPDSEQPGARGSATLEAGSRAVSKTSLDIVKMMFHPRWIGWVRKKLGDRKCLKGISGL